MSLVINKENKKIKNATPSNFAGVALKSQTEKLIWKTLKELNIEALYEPEKIVLIEGFKPTKLFYTKKRIKTLVNNKIKKHWELRDNNDKIINITYTPDFVFKLNGYKVYLEVKGFENDTYPIKKKLFRRWMETQDYPIVYAEIYTKKELLKLIEKINAKL